MNTLRHVEAGINYFQSHGRCAPPELQFPTMGYCTLSTGIILVTTLPLPPHTSKGSQSRSNRDFVPALALVGGLRGGGPLYKSQVPTLSTYIAEHLENGDSQFG